ncbi:TetR/AcrR family transcriptional regulator [Nocardioides sp. W3-2-3]|nr:TetR/AcrR family transcriptional regulator [Nocardioides convexus]
MGQVAPREPKDEVGRTPKGTASRAQILDRVAEVFADVGFDRARMADLIAATGMTKGAVYFYFDGKEALALAVLERKHDQWLAAVREKVAVTRPGLARLRGLTAAMLDLHVTHPDAWAVSRLTNSLAEVPTARPHAALLNQRWVDFVAGLVGEAQSMGDVRADVDAAALATVLVGAFDGIKATVAVLAEDGERAGQARGGERSAGADAAGLPHRDEEVTPRHRARQMR